MQYLLFDTETSGLVEPSLMNDELQPDVIEFYGCVIEPAKITTQEGRFVGVLEDCQAELEFLAKPRKPISDMITKITGITNERLADAPPFAANIERVKALFTQADAIVAHNLSFDLQMVRMEFARAGEDFDKLIEGKRLICTVEQTEWIRGYRLNLTALHEHLFGSGFTGAHSAKNDVQALTRCFVKLLADGDL